MRATADLSDLLSRDSFGEGPDDGTQEFCEPPQEQAEVIAGRGEDGVDAVADAGFEIVAVHAVLGLDVADDGLDSRTTLHLAPDGSRDAADLPRDPDPEPVRVVVAAVPFVDMDSESVQRGKLPQVRAKRTKRGHV